MSTNEAYAAHIPALIAYVEDLKREDWVIQHLRHQDHPSFWSIIEYSKNSYEIRYSRMLRWLLDPWETHGWGTRFADELDAFCAGQAPDEAPRDDSVDPTVRRTRSTCGADTEALNANIDVFAYDEHKGRAITIEVKQFASEGTTSAGTSQLQKYYESVTNHDIYGAAKYRARHFVFLTIDGEEPAEQEDGDQPWRQAWIPLSYTDLIDLLTTCLPDVGNLDAAKIVLDFIHDLRKTMRLHSRPAQQAAAARPDLADLVSTLNSYWTSPEEEEPSDDTAAELAVSAITEAARRDLDARTLKEIVALLAAAAQGQNHTPSESVQRVIGALAQRLAGLDVEVRPNQTVPLALTGVEAGGYTYQCVRRTRGKGQGLNFYIGRQPADEHLDLDNARRVYLSGDSQGNIPNDGFGLIGSKLRHPMKNGTYKADTLLADEDAFDAFVDAINAGLGDLLHRYVDEIAGTEG